MTDTPDHTEQSDYAIRIRDGVRNILGDGLDKVRSNDHLDILMDQIFAFAEGVIEDIKRNFPAEEPVACAAGCAFCCHNHEVHVSVPEALRLASHLSGIEGREIIAGVRERLAAAMAAKDADNRQAGEQRPRKLFPCPLLDPETNMCQVYDVRPMVCRGHNSINKTACELRFAGGVEEGARIIGGAPQRVAAQSVLSGIRLALTDRGQEDLAVDLTRALDVLLDPESAPDGVEELHAPERLKAVRARTSA